MNKNYLIKLTVLTLSLMLIFSWGNVMAAGEIMTPEEAGITEYKEAPQLNEKVNSGELPPVAERLPETPLVLNPVETIGEYGGTWNRIHTAPGMGNWQITNLYEPLVRWKMDLSGYVPGLARDWEFNEDGTEFTIFLRKGIKYSDGEPFTTEDFLFWWEDMALDEEFPESVPHWMTRAGEPAQVEAVDEYTLKFTFSEPNWVFPGHLAQGHWRTTTNLALRPKHYLKQFHPKYNPEVETTEELEEKITNTHLDPDYPVLSPWMTVSYEEGKRLVAERNPYYYVVDSEGNQLPYIDEVVSRKVSDTEAQVLTTVAGDIDLMFRGFKLRDYTLLKKNEEKGGYEMFLWERGDGGSPMIFINWDVGDPKYKELFRNQNFRKALSFAIDRNYINEVVYQGLGTIQNATMSEFLLHYNYHSEGEEAGKALHEDWAKAYATFDTVQAKELLDQAGYVDQDGDGWRDFKNGETIHLLIDTGAEDVISIDANTILAENWRDVGLKTDVNPITGAQMQMRQEDDTIMFKTFGYGSEVDLLTYPDNVFPISNTRFHFKTGLYYQTGGKEGVEPTGPMKKLIDIYEEALDAEPPLNHQKVLEAVKVHMEDGPFIYCPVARLPSIAIKKENIRNIPEFGITGPWAPGFPGATFPGQYFFEGGSN